LTLQTSRVTGVTHEYSEEKENELILDYKNKKGDSKKKSPH
jgi:hypothetical protein